MNIRKITAAAAVIAALVTAVGCGDKNKDSSSQAPVASTSAAQSQTNSDIKEGDGPRLYFSNTEAAPGEIAEVSMYVENADAKWSVCGIHVTFDNALECQMFRGENNEDNYIEYKKGEASEYSSASVGMLWVNDLPEELTSNNLGCLFFTEICDDDHGLDGEIVKFFFKVPEDAVSGTVYPIGIYYMENNDLFINAANEKSFQDYAFSHWEGGSVTVK